MPRGVRVKICPGVQPGTTGFEVGGGLDCAKSVTYDRFHTAEFGLLIVGM